MDEQSVPQPEERPADPVAEPAPPRETAPPENAGAPYATAGRASDRPGAASPTFAAPGFAPPPPRKAFPWAPFLGGTVFGCGCLPWLALFLIIVIAMSAGTSETGGPRGDSVGLINVTGIITSGDGDGGFLGSAGADAQGIIRRLEAARTNDRIKAVVLYINSPGGSAAGSDAVYQAVEKLRAAKKPVVVAMGDVAASGGYYIASAADRIFANGATVTGSIGVITELPNFSDPNGWISKSGYDQVVIKSGKYKDMGNPFRPMTPDERALFQQMVNDIYNQFLTAVSTARKMPLARLKPLADGRVFTGRQAVKNGLIDEIGGLDQAMAYAGEKVGLGPDPKVYKMGGTALERLLGETNSITQSIAQRKALSLLLLDPRAQALSESLGSAR
jgi:protease-4